MTPEMEPEILSKYQKTASGQSIIRKQRMKYLLYDVP